MKFPGKGMYQVIVGFHLLLLQVQSCRPVREINVGFRVSKESHAVCIFPAKWADCGNIHIWPSFIFPSWDNQRESLAVLFILKQHDPSHSFFSNWMDTCIKNERVVTAWHMISSNVASIASTHMNGCKLLYPIYGFPSNDTDISRNMA